MNWRPSQSEVVIWLRMIMRACYLLIGAAAVLGLSDAVVALLVIVTGLCDYRLSLFSDLAVGEARSAPSIDQAQRIRDLESELAAARAWEPRPRGDSVSITIPEMHHQPPAVPEPPDQGVTLPGYRVNDPQGENE